jgi:hypothetical protein
VLYPYVPLPNENVLINGRGFDAQKPSGFNIVAPFLLFKAAGSISGQLAYVYARV